MRPRRQSAVVRLGLVLTGGGLVLFGGLTACGDRTPPAGAPGAPPASSGARKGTLPDGRGAAGTATSGVPAGVPSQLPTFVDVAAEAGAVVENHTGKPSEKDWIVSAMGGGTIALDYDADGDMDILVVDGTMLTEEGVLEYHDSMRTRLLRNDTDANGLRFTEVTKEAGIDVQAFGFGGAACDYDGDGDADVYICCWGRNYLLRNRGDGTFEEVAAATGVLGDDRDMSTACAWGDVDGDGLHDLYVANYSDQWHFIEECRRDGKKGRSTKWRDFPVYVGPQPIPPQMDRLYLGTPDGTFREVTETHLRNQRPYYGFQPIMTDVDNDGDLDIFVANDTQSNHLWVNDAAGTGAKGVFDDLAVKVGVASSGDFNEQAGMGVDAGDQDRDGWIDLTVTNFSDDYNTIYRNRTARQGVLQYTDASNVTGIVQPSFKRLSWGVAFLDYDNDGWLDHFVTCGHVYGEIEGFEKTTQTSYKQRCQLLRNNGPTAFKFTDVTDRSGPAFDVRRVWRGAAFGDFDDDGDTDVFCVGLNDKSALFRNDGGNRNAWVRIRLVGKGTQRDPSGARVLLHMPKDPAPDAKPRVHVGELHHGTSFCSDNDPRLLFGCGALATVPKIEILWRDGTRQEFKDVPTRRAYVATQGSAELAPDIVPKR